MIRFLRKILVLAIAAAVSIGALMAQSGESSSTGQSQPAASVYATQIEPIFQSKCLGCHDQSHQAGGLVLESYESLLKGGKLGQVIVPGNAAKSRMVLELEGKIKPQMPFSQKPLDAAEITTISRWIDAGAPGPEASVAPMPDHPAASELGIEFVSNSKSTLIVERGGKSYLVDLEAHTISPLPPPATAAGLQQTPPAPPQPVEVAAAHPSQKRGIYGPADDFLMSLPTGRRLDRHGWYVNFNHRFPYSTAFAGRARGHVLGGLDDFSVSSFGFRYGVTEKLSLSVYRSPSVIGRPIELMAAYNFLDERDGQPLNAAVRFSIDGQNDFGKNFSENIEGIFSRSLTRRAQIYFAPTVSFQARPLVSAQGALENPPPTLPGTNSFSLGVGGALDIRPTVALVAEVIPTLVNGGPLGVHRPAYSFGIQKKIWRHAFTFGFTNSPGTTVSQRAGTRATFLNDPSADTPSGLFIGFDLTRQLK